jgi:ribose transport system substrate-binding protein
MHPTRLAALAAAAVTLAALPSCSTDNRPRVAFVSNNAADFWTIAQAGCRKAEKDFGDVRVEFKQPDPGTAAQQKSVVEDLVGSGVKAISVSVINPAGQTAFINTVVDGGTPFIAVDNDAPESKRLCYIGTDNYEAGKAAGKLVKEAIPDGGVVAVFVGQIEPLNSRQRMQGVLDELAGQKDAKGPTYGKYRLFGQTEPGEPYKAARTDDVDSRRAKDNATDAIDKLKDEKAVCMVGLWAPNPPAILSAVKDAGKLGQVKIVGFDEMDATLDGIEAGHIHGTIVQQPFEFGRLSVVLMRKIVRGEEPKLEPSDEVVVDGKAYNVKHRVIKKDGVPEKDQVVNFRKSLKEMLGKK